MRLKSIFSVQNIASVSFIKVCSSTRLSSQTKGGLTCEIVAAEIGFLFIFDSFSLVIQQMKKGKIKKRVFLIS